MISSYNPAVRPALVLSIQYSCPVQLLPSFMVKPGINKECNVFLLYIFRHSDNFGTCVRLIPVSKSEAFKECLRDSTEP